MRLIKPSFEILSLMGMTEDGCYKETLKLIELAGRTCYKTEDKITSESAIQFVQKINKLGHESVIEHSAMTVKFICDRGVSHELVRHRLASFSQESTRYCNYKGGVTFVIPPWVNIEEGEYTTEAYSGPDGRWFASVQLAEYAYQNLLAEGWHPQQARSVLPNSTKTEIVVTANFREWKHILKMRCQAAAHPQMREIMIPLHRKCKEMIPIIFDEITY